MTFIHPTAEVSNKAKLGNNVKLWNQVQVREDAQIGENTSIGKNSYIDFGVKIGKNVKIQNNVSIYHGVDVEDGVYIGPNVCFINDKFPRAINPDGSLKSNSDWKVVKSLIKSGASIGAHSVVLSVTLGSWALVGSGSVVTKDVPNYGLVYGNPAKLIGYVCRCGKPLLKKCEVCGVSLSEVKK